MGQNSDIHNIFESYSNKVMVKEQTVLNDADYQNAYARFKKMPEGTEKNELNKQLEKMKPLASAAPSTVAKPVEVDGTKPASPTPSPAPSPQSNTGEISIGGMKLPAPKQPTTAPTNSQGGAVTAQMPTTSPSSQGNTAVDVKIPASLGGMGATTTAPTNTQGGAVTAQMPTTPQSGSTSNVDVKIPASLGGGGTASKAEDGALRVGNINIGNPEAAQETETPTKAAAGSGKKQSASGGGSIVDYLAGKNQAFDKASRGKLAAQYGIQNYTGTAEQNAQLLNKLRANEKMPQGTNASGEKQYAAGTVPKAPANDTQQQPQQQQPQQQQGMGGIIGGASKLAGGAGNLAKKALIGDQPLGGIIGGASKLAGGAGNLFKKALIGGGGQQQAAPTQQAAPVQQTAPVQKQAPTKQQTPTKKATGLAADKYVEDEEIQENKNIAKFVKCLSEKNFSQANEYLKKIVNSKVEKNLHKVINKI